MGSSAMKEDGSGSRIDAIFDESIPRTSARLNRSTHSTGSPSIAHSWAGEIPLTRGEFSATSLAKLDTLSRRACTVLVNCHRFLRNTGADWQNPGFTQADRDPVVCLNWDDAIAYTRWLNGKVRSQTSSDGIGPYGLACEADDREYAARAGTQTAYWWGDTIGSGHTACDGCGSGWDNKQPAPVGSFPPNPFGLYDVLGSKWEWAMDCWNDNYAGAQTDSAAWTIGKCERRVARGGDWGNRPWVLRSGHRTGFLELRQGVQFHRLPRCPNSPVTHERGPPG